MSPLLGPYATMLAIGIGIGVLLHEGCAERTVVERERIERTVDTAFVVHPPDTVRIPEAYAVVKWRDRLVAQIDSSDGRRDTVLVAEAFNAEWSGIDSTSGASAQGRIEFPPLRVTDLRVACPPDTSLVIRDSVTIDRTHVDRPLVALGIGPYAGINHKGESGYGIGASLVIIIGSF